MSKKKHDLILVHWFGPFELDQIIESDWGKEKGLYLITGKQKGDRGDAQLQYCGKTADLSYAKRLGHHHRLPLVTREAEIWLGQLPFVSDEKFPYYLDKSEKLLTYYLDPIINEKNTKAIPGASTVVSYWFKPSKELRQKRIFVAQKEVDDVISWDGEFWHTGNLDSGTNCVE